METKRICVYTCITGNYDNLKEIDNKETGIDYYCFTNNKNIQSNTWKVIYIEDNELSNIQLARKIKILGHPKINKKYDIFVWMDGAVSFRKKIIDFINTYLKKDDVFVAFKHGERNTIAEEGKACIRFKKETKENVEKVLSFYEKENYKDNNGLIESTVFIKRGNIKKIDETMRLWFDMILNFSIRDQLSFNYCIYKTNLKVKWINEKVFDNDWFEWEIHNNKKTVVENYRVYFGDENDYDTKFDIQGKYRIKNNTYHFKIKIPNTTNSTVIKVTDVPCVIFDNIEIKNVDSKDYEIFNCINYKNKNVFYNDKSIIRINKELIEGDYLEFSIVINVMDNYEKNRFIEFLSIDNLILNVQKEQLSEELTKKNEMINNNIILRTVLKYKEKR